MLQENFQSEDRAENKHEFKRLQQAMEMVGFLPATKKQYVAHVETTHLTWQPFGLMSIHTGLLEEVLVGYAHEEGVPFSLEKFPFFITFLNGRLGLVNPKKKRMQ